jgi:membrane protein YqaA with SNARE-associated domain
MINRTKIKRSFFQTLQLRHQNNIRTKLYPFLIKNTVKMVIVLALIIAGIIFLDKFLDLEKILNNLIQRHSKGYVLAIFLVSESILGWIPPDLFIAWAEQFDYKFLYLALLATISYIGGINAYFIGFYMSKFPRIRNWVSNKNEKYFKMIRKWGGFVIIFAALLPLPYATTSTAAGMLKYPFKQFILYGLTRYLRFFLYALAIFGAINKISL